jgi:hypothetical protein
MARRTNQLETVQQSLKKAQGLAEAPQLLLQIKEQLETATRMSESLADDYHRTQQRVRVLEGMVRVALDLAGYSNDMIEDLEAELEGGT